ncbi:hypothetical protein [Enterococcus mundtii]
MKTVFESTVEEFYQTKNRRTTEKQKSMELLFLKRQSLMLFGEN